jgi:streptogrisin D
VDLFEESKTPSVPGRRHVSVRRRVGAVAVVGSVVVGAMLAPVGAHADVPVLSDLAMPSETVLAETAQGSGVSDSAAPAEGPVPPVPIPPEAAVPSGTADEEEGTVPPDYPEPPADGVVDVPVISGITALAAEALAGTLGPLREAGVYLDDDGRMVVNVTDPAAEADVRSAGGIPKVVKHSMDHLTSITAKLDESSVSTPGTAWGIDPVTNQVLVEADASVPDAEIERIRGVIGVFGDAVRLVRLDHVLTPSGSPAGLDPVAELAASGGIPMRGGQSITGGTSSEPRAICTSGFNVRHKSTKAKHFITAGHCMDDSPRWQKSTGGAFLGERVEFSWGKNGHDYGLVDYKNADIHALGVVWRGDGREQDINHSRRAVVGEKVTKRGKSSGNGVEKKVKATGVTVTVSGTNKRLKNMIKTGHCGEPGDSGGPLFADKAALGIASIAGNPPGPGNCRTYFQPIGPALDEYNMEVY